MKQFSMILLLIFCSACSLSNKKNLYEIKLLSGDLLYSNSAPKIENDYYHFDDLNGQKYIIQKRSILYVQEAQFKR